MTDQRKRRSHKNDEEVFVMANVQAAVEAQLFGANVVGVVSRGKKDQKMITQFLVMPSEQEGNKWVSVDDVVKEINRTIYKLENDGEEMPDGHTGPVDKNQVNNVLSIVGLQNAEFKFMQTFVYYKGEKPIANSISKIDDLKKGDLLIAGEQAADNDQETKKHLEYAIGIRIKSQKSPSTDDFNFLSIREIYINVWDTERQKVLDRMNIWTLDEIGENLGVEPV